jgi:hypothetical protein
MLTEEKKNQIRLEETYRAEIRRSLQSDKTSRRQRLLDFLNSAFGLWVLSTCVVGALTFAYTSQKEAGESTRLRREACERLEVEIARRMSELEYEFRRVEAQHGIDSQRGRLFEALNTVRSPRYPVFKEFKNRPLSSILFERYHLASEHEVANWKSLFDLASALETSYQTPSLPADTKAISKQAKTLLKRYTSLGR